MTDTQLLACITADPGTMAGKPVVRGPRLAVEYLLKLLAYGATLQLREGNLNEAYCFADF